MNQITVYIDGQCPVCVAGAERFQRFDAQGRVRFVNLHEPEWAARAAERFSGSDMMGEMRVEMPNGSWRIGYFGWAAILENLPRWRWLGRLMQWRIFYGIGPAVYRRFADNRQLISKIFRLPPPCDENGVCRLRT